MISARIRNWLAAVALAASLLPWAAPVMVLAADLCIDVFDPPTGMKKVCFDCNSISLSAEQERRCNVHCDEKENKGKSSCYRRRPMDPEEEEENGGHSKKKR